MDEKVLVLQITVKLNEYATFRLISTKRFNKIIGFIEDINIVIYLRRKYFYKIGV